MHANIKTATYKPKKSDIEAIRKKTTSVERALHSLENLWKAPTNMKDINKWQKSVEEKINYLTKTLFEINEVVKNNIQNIKEMKNVLQHNYENIKTIFGILKNLFEKDKKDKSAIYSTLKKKLPF
ncbi:MAG: hypothetical protein JSV93_01555 [Candidatus Omnitrophota bacterium]|nr:MAG: hypothetical protein JSV93_01555 [Candidatus Omnitrophota bacterium]